MKNNNSLRQYIELFDSNRKAIEEAAPEVLNRHRQAARDLLDDAWLPDRHTEGYERTSVNDMFAPDFGVNISRLDLPADLKASFRCGVPNLSTLTGVTVNDIFHSTAALESRLPEGIFFGSLSKACREIPEVVERYYGSVAPADNVCVALNSMLVQNGTVIYVPDGMKLERPLQNVNLLSADFPLMAVRRLLVVLGRGASLSLLNCDHTATPGIGFAISQVIEVVMGEDSSLDYCDIEEASATTERHSMAFIRQETGSRLNLTGVTLQGGVTRNEFAIDITGKHCDTGLRGMAIGCDSQHIDNSSVVRHISGGSSSRQLFKYVLDDRSTGAFEGSIVVNDGAAFTEAYQANRNVLASKEARMHTRPQLEIYNDDVKCSHGATTGQLDAEALFYMRTRGIPEHEARTMLMQAFMTDVIESITMPGLRERLHHLVEQRFRRHEARCQECSADFNNDNCNAYHSDL